MAAPASTLLLAWHLQVLLSPDPPHALAVYLPALPAQDRVLLLVAQARVALGELVQSAAKMFLVGNDASPMALGGTVLADHGTCPSLGGPEAILQAADRLTTSFGAYQFPLATSLSMSMSRPGWPPASSAGHSPCAGSSARRPLRGASLGTASASDGRSARRSRGLYRPRRAPFLRRASARPHAACGSPARVCASCASCDSPPALSGLVSLTCGGPVSGDPATLVILT